MNFSEAMDKLASGSKVSRISWNAQLYYKYVDGEVQAFQQEFKFYPYDENTMLSDEWVLQQKIDDKEYKFCEIVTFLKDGYLVKRKDWSNAYIYYDKDLCVIMLCIMVKVDKAPEFDSFIAEDWIEL